jgi:hypothetical protein
MTTTKAELERQRINDHIAKTVESWPAPTPQQVRTVTLMLRAAAGITAPAAWVERPEDSERRKAEDALAQVRREFSEALDGCHGCGISEKAHKYQEGYGTGYHPFQPLSPDGAIKVAQAYKKKINAADKALEAARG